MILGVGERASGASALGVGHEMVSDLKLAEKMKSEQKSHFSSSLKSIIHNESNNEKQYENEDKSAKYSMM